MNSSICLDELQRLKGVGLLSVINFRCGHTYRHLKAEVDNSVSRMCLDFKVIYRVLHISLSYKEP